jgi:hypothetical protein
MTEAELEQWILLAKWGADRVRRFRVFMTGFASVPSSRDLILATLITHNPKDYMGVPNLPVLSRS